MTSFLKAKNIRIFDYPRFAQTHRDDIRTNTEAIAKEHEIEIQFIKRTHIRKDDLKNKFHDSNTMTKEHLGREVSCYILPVRSAK